MKIRKLRVKLNTKYPISNHCAGLVIGDATDDESILVRANKPECVMPYRIENPSWDVNGIAEYEIELTRLYNLLKEMIASGEMSEYMEQDDDISTLPIPVYSCEDEELITSYTEELAYPNIDHRGFILYVNKFFATPGEAVERAIHLHESRVESIGTRIQELEIEMVEQKQEIARRHVILSKLTGMLSEER